MSRVLPEEPEPLEVDSPELETLEEAQIEGYESFLYLIVALALILLVVVGDYCETSLY